MRYTILTKGDSKSNALKHKMINHMKDFQMVEDMKILKLSFQLGDGTLLQAFHQYSHMLSKVAFVGIHTGHLDFMQIGYLMKLKSLLLKLIIRSFKLLNIHS